MNNLSDHALVVHVWHLDVLEDLIEAAANLPATTDQFVTLPDSFDSEQRNRVATAFPRAQLVEVENRGQDVGALFQLMQKVDLGRYDFLCKIHSKKGPNMPDEWRRALLDGVLGSEPQASDIIERFRADPQIMLAGARQLFVHGPSYLAPNTEALVECFGRLIGDFDYESGDWGFVAGTCFWIRTEILLDMAACQPDFPTSEYVTDGTSAHAAERMFGLSVALRGGKVLLQDLRFPDRQPEAEQGFPADLPHKWLRLAQILTPLAVNMFLKPRRRRQADMRLANRRRVAVFASYTGDGVLPPQVIPYLEGLQPLTEAIVVVCDNDLLPDEAEKLSTLATHVITGRHGEYDFGSYKRGIDWLKQAGLLERADSLILCNDSCYGPIGSFEPMFAEMEAKNLDFWGATDSQEINYHLQSYFVVLNRKVFISDAFNKFIASIEKQKNVQEVIKKYEIGMTQNLVKAGFMAGAMLSNELMGLHEKDPTYRNLTFFQHYAISRGVPLIKVKALRKPTTNANGSNILIDWLRWNEPKIFDCVVSDFEIQKLRHADQVRFSIIMPTYNREWCISRAIYAVLAQTHQNFELIIVDDGSSDNTEQEVRRRFLQDLESGRIVYIKLDKNVGVCRARNIGLAHADADWIAYADTDNEMRPYFLTMAANLILKNPGKDAVYGRMMNVNSGLVIGVPFSVGNVVNANFIDLGTFIHKRSLVSRFGGFDDSFRRLVDWDLCVRYTRHKEPAFIERVVLDYVDEDREDRISVRESYLKADIRIRRKHSPKPTVSTVIISYNHADFIVEAIESALEQKGDFHHEILLADDGSTDGTARIMDHYAQKYPKRIRNISRGKNFGISENYRHSFHEAQGEFVAVLEGDDYWTDPHKNLKQVEFLRAHDNATMVLSKVEVFDMRSGKRRLLKRQEGLPQTLSAVHFAANEHLNLIANFSSCMFRADIMQQLPDSLYDPRPNEIALAFYLDRLGAIGFLPEVMSTYRQNDASVWTGASSISRHEQAIKVRQAALRVARPVYRSIIQKHIDARQKLLAAELEKATIAA